MTPEERFERIEATLERVTDRLDRISEGHQELETAQMKQQRGPTRLGEAMTALTEESREWKADSSEN